MRRDPRIINSYDKPLYPRSRAVRDPLAAEYGTPLLSCATIVLAVTGFFWLYGSIMHRDPPLIPAMVQTETTSRYVLGSYAPSPVADMNSPAVALANADVPREVIAAQAQANAAAEPIPAADAEPVHKKTPRVVTRSPEAHARSSASGYGPPDPGRVY